MYDVEKSIAQARENFNRLIDYVEGPAVSEEAHGVEKHLLRGGMEVLRALLEAYFAAQEGGDVGSAVQFAGGAVLGRERCKPRRYLSVFGELELRRAYYHEDGAGGVFPMDEETNLPERVYSYFVQELVEREGVRLPYEEAVRRLEEFFGWTMPKRSVEVLAPEASRDVDAFYEAEGAPAAESEGEVLVVAVDGKGVPLVKEGPAEDPVRLKKGEKRSRKKPATVVATYTIAPQVRRVEDILGEIRGVEAGVSPEGPGPGSAAGGLGRAEAAGAAGGSGAGAGEVSPAPVYEVEVGRGERPGTTASVYAGKKQIAIRWGPGLRVLPEGEVAAARPEGEAAAALRPKTARPRPQNKRVRASLEGKKEGFEWAQKEVARRDPAGRKRRVCLMDGDPWLWGWALKMLVGFVFIIDIFHVLEYLWKAAYVFYREGSPEAEAFVYQRLRMLLEGKVGYVIGGLKEMRTKHRLRGKKRKALEQVIGYLERYRAYMKYDEYLAAGLPIGSGAVEGACRHLVADRMEGSGMRWTQGGAEAVLKLRAVYLNGDWDRFWAYHVEREKERRFGGRKWQPGMVAGGPRSAEGSGWGEVLAFRRPGVAEEEPLALAA